MLLDLGYDMSYTKTTFFAAAAVLWATTGTAATLIDGTTLGLYNSGIGTSLNGTSAVFPTAGDPIIDIPASSPPDLSAAAAALGGWLTTPATPGGTWTGPQAIPANWTVTHETAIIYELDGGSYGLENVMAKFGIDNGIFVWLNGTFLGGHLRPGGAFLGEFTLDLGDVAAGTNYLQILREDHGGGTGYRIEVTGDAAPPPSPVPLPAGGMLLLSTLGALGLIRRKRPS